MAGTLDITWNNPTPPPLGSYRVAYRYPAWNGNAASAGYPAYVIVGATCFTPTCLESIVLPILTDDACEPLNIDGYVQAGCEPNDGITNIEPFSITFTPAEPCNAVQFEVITPDTSAPVGIGNNCDGNPYGTLQGKAPGEIFNICYPGGVAGMGPVLEGNIIAAGYSLTDNPAICCYECQEVTIIYTDLALGRVQYVDCSTGVLGSFTPPPGISGSTTVCAKPDSWATDDTINITFVVGGPCP
jgi:hypothetical protein